MACLYDVIIIYTNFGSKVEIGLFGIANDSFNRTEVTLLTVI